MAINVILYFSLCLIIIAHTRCKTTQGPVQITPPGNVDNHEENNIGDILSYCFSTLLIETFKNRFKIFG